MSSSREEALKISCEKIKIEAEITEWKSVLDSEQNIGMDGPLVDNEGYPRNDLDIPKIRMARQKIICLSNDHKEIMKKLASLLEDIHSQTPSENEPDQSQSAPMDMDPHGPNMPFARVDFINIGSPAQDAGLQRGDLIVEFGTQNNSNFKNLMDIGNMVINSENRPIRIKLMRNGTPMTINLVPKKWSGKGLLGCKMIPLYKEC